MQSLQKDMMDNTGLGLGLVSSPATVVSGVQCNQTDLSLILTSEELQLSRSNSGIRSELGGSCGSYINQLLDTLSEARAGRLEYVRSLIGITLENSFQKGSHKLPTQHKKIRLKISKYTGSICDKTIIDDLEVPT